MSVTLAKTDFLNKNKMGKIEPQKSISNWTHGKKTILNETDL